MAWIDMAWIPKYEECIKLLKEEGCSENVIEHCKAVRTLALQIAKLANADPVVVEAGALLHDIGRSKTHGIMHAIEGAKIAQRLGLDSRLVKIIERHIAAGISKEEAEKAGLPPKKYMPKTLEEKIVAHADNLIDSNKKVPVSITVSSLISKGFQESAKRVLKLHQELSEICGIDLDKLPFEKNG
ncbi:MAG: HDIG domain-containing protein [Thermoplasmata archaeon]